MIRSLRVPFHGNDLYVVDHNNEPYVPMRPVVEGMGLDWKTQFRKIVQKFKSTVVNMTMVAEDGKNREMICMPLRKLPAWLYSVNPNKVKPELKEKVIQYQEECDEVLWQYWTKGIAIKEKVQRELDEWREREGISFSKGSKAGKQLAVRRKEKSFIHRKINQLEKQLIQPDLFIAACC